MGLSWQIKIAFTVLPYEAKHSYLCSLVTLTQPCTHAILCKTTWKILSPFFFFFSPFQLHCSFQKSTFWLKRFITYYRTDCVFVDKEQQCDQGPGITGGPKVHEGSTWQPGAGQPGDTGEASAPAPVIGHLPGDRDEPRSRPRCRSTDEGQDQAWWGGPGSPHPGWPVRAMEMGTGMDQGQAGMTACGWGFGSEWVGSQTSKGRVSTQAEIKVSSKEGGLLESLFPAIFPTTSP